MHTFISINNKHAPVKAVNIKNKSDKPWTIPQLKRSIKVLGNLFKKWLLTKSNSLRNKINFYRNKIANINKFSLLQILASRSDGKDRRTIETTTPCWRLITLTLYRPPRCIAHPNKNKVLVNSTDSKEMWDNINFYTNKKKSSSYVSKLPTNDLVFTQHHSIANEIKNYFRDVQNSLVSKLSNQSKHFKS